MSSECSRRSLLPHFPAETAESYRLICPIPVRGTPAFPIANPVSVFPRRRTGHTTCDNFAAALLSPGVFCHSGSRNAVKKPPSENRGGLFIQTYFTANRHHSAFCFTAQGNGAYLSSSLRMRIGINSPSPAPQSSVRACGHGIERPHPQNTWRPACSLARRPGT